MLQERLIRRLVPFGAGPAGRFDPAGASQAAADNPRLARLVGCGLFISPAHQDPSWPNRMPRTSSPCSRSSACLPEGSVARTTQLAADPARTGAAAGRHQPGQLSAENGISRRHVYEVLRHRDRDHQGQRTRRCSWSRSSTPASSRSATFRARCRCSSILGVHCPQHRCTPTCAPSVADVMHPRRLPAGACWPKSTSRPCSTRRCSSSRRKATALRRSSPRLELVAPATPTAPATSAPPVSLSHAGRGAGCGGVGYGAGLAHGCRASTTLLWWARDAAQVAILRCSARAATSAICAMSNCRRRWQLTADRSARHLAFGAPDGLIVVATPMAALRSPCSRCVPAKIRRGVAVQGLRSRSAARLGHEIANAVPAHMAAAGVVSGPSFALEVASATSPRRSSLPAMTSRCANACRGRRCHGDSLRIYTSRRPGRRGSGRRGEERAGDRHRRVPTAWPWGRTHGLPSITRGLAEMTRLGHRPGRACRNPHGPVGPGRPGAHRHRRSLAQPAASGLLHWPAAKRWPASWQQPGPCRRRRLQRAARCWQRARRRWAWRCRSRERVEWRCLMASSTHRRWCGP